MHIYWIAEEQGNAEKSRIIMVGDTLKKASESSSSSSGGGLIEIKDFGDTEYDYVLHYWLVTSITIAMLASFRLEGIAHYYNLFPKR